MNKYSFLILTVYFLCACGNNNADKSHSDNDEVDTAQVSYGWEASLNDSSGKLEMKKVEEEGLDTLSVATVVAFLNNLNSKVQLELVKTSNDTVYLKIPDAAYLTQQSGDAGAKMIMAEVVYNLTEIPGIKYVNLNFEQGDHAGPGTYTRESFEHD